MGREDEDEDADADADENSADEDGDAADGDGKRRQQKKKSWRRPDTIAFQYCAAVLDQMGSEEATRDALHRLVSHMWTSNALTYLSAAHARALVARLQEVPAALPAPFFTCFGLVCCAMVTSSQVVSAPTRAEHDALCDETWAHCCAGLALAEEGTDEATPTARSIRSPSSSTTRRATPARRGRLLAARDALQRAASAPKATAVPSRPPPLMAVSRAIDGLSSPSRAASSRAASTRRTRRLDRTRRDGTGRGGRARRGADGRVGVGRRARRVGAARRHLHTKRAWRRERRRGE